ncbi:conserved protein of unknown function [Pseudomonas marincola]|uniref:Uncharacterized protein n=1 Tax=Pseudomonas marincola TaxID=437900 RepID=A0A653E7H4_9PSED|nr:hypothetical protein [Pseudomonas marincola]CAE6913696.1 conserved protein of unknown function [Pseudomonas marincola]
MSKQPNPLDASEQQLIEHYRTHHDLQPSAVTDASIMQAASAAASAAARAAKKPAASSSVLSRLHAWLFAGERGGRWPVALASVMVIGVAVGLVFNTVEPEPTAYDSPAARQYAAPAMHEQQASKKVLERSQAQQSPQLSAPSAKPEMEAAAPPASVASMASSAESKTDNLQLAVDEQTRAQLLEILDLRKAGDTAEANARIQRLQQRLPALDIEQQLTRLAKER